jgi:hypothetical protein
MLPFILSLGIAATSKWSLRTNAILGSISWSLLTIVLLYGEVYRENPFVERALDNPSKSQYFSAYSTELVFNAFPLSATINVAQVIAACLVVHFYRKIRNRKVSEEREKYLSELQQSEKGQNTDGAI